MGNRQARSGAGRHRGVQTQHNSHGNDVNVTSSSSKPQQQQQQSTGDAPDAAGRQLQVNIYRSYSQLGGDGRPPSRHRDRPAPTPLEYRVYRRSARPPPHLSAASRSMSLPRSFGRAQARLGADQLDASTMPRPTSSRPIARSSSRASNISSTPSAKGQ